MLTHLWQPPARPGPGLVLVHEIFGAAADRGRDLAVLGYVVCAPEVYWRLDDHDLDEDSPDALDRAIRFPADRLGRRDQHLFKTPSATCAA